MFWLGIGVAYLVGTVATILLMIIDDHKTLRKKEIKRYQREILNFGEYIWYLKIKYQMDDGDNYYDWLSNRNSTDKRD